MFIDAYFRQISELIESCPAVESSNVTYDRRTRHEGFVRGELFFVDGSVLHIREFVDTEEGIDRLTYVYQYMDTSQALVFRYDNTGHHKKLNLPTYPHHKHVASADVVVASPAPNLQEILNEVMMLVSLL